jgi:hypothetical protein
MPGPLKDSGLPIVHGDSPAASDQYPGDYGADVTWVEPPGGDPYKEVLAAANAFSNRESRVWIRSAHRRGSMGSLGSWMERTCSVRRGAQATPES